MNNFVRHSGLRFKVPLRLGLTVWGVVLVAVLRAQLYSCTVSAPDQCLASLRTNSGLNKLDLFFVCSPVEKPLLLSMPDTSLSVEVDKVTIIIIQTDTITGKFTLRKTSLPNSVFPATKAYWQEEGISILARTREKGKLDYKRLLNNDGINELFFLDTASLSLKKQAEIELRRKKVAKTPVDVTLFKFSTVESGFSVGIIVSDSILRINKTTYLAPQGKCLRSRFKIQRNGDVAWNVTDTLEAEMGGELPVIFASAISSKGEIIMVSNGTRSVSFGSSLLQAAPVYNKRSAAKFYYVLKYDSLGNESWGSTIASERSKLYYMDLAFEDSGSVILSGAFDGTLTFRTNKEQKIVHDKIVIHRDHWYDMGTQLFAARLYPRKAAEVFLVDTTALFIIPAIALIGVNHDPGIFRHVDTSYLNIDHPTWVTKLSPIEGGPGHYLFPGKLISDMAVEKMGAETLIKILVNQEGESSKEFPKGKMQFRYEWFLVRT